MALVSAVVGITAGSAVASVPAKWSQASIAWSGTLTLKPQFGTSTTCTFTKTNASGESEKGGSGYIMLAGSFENKPLTISCANGKVLNWIPVGFADYEAGYRLEVDSNETIWSMKDPFGGEWGASGAKVPFTNGSGATASKITFSNTIIGWSTVAGAMYATGSLNVTTVAGGLLTLSK